jgi:hypothetical protein
MDETIYKYGTITIFHSYIKYLSDYINFEYDNKLYETEFSDNIIITFEDEKYSNYEIKELNITQETSNNDYHNNIIYLPNKYTLHQNLPYLLNEKYYLNISPYFKNSKYKYEEMIPSRFTKSFRNESEKNVLCITKLRNGKYTSTYVFAYDPNEPIKQNIEFIICKIFIQ